MRETRLSRKGSPDGGEEQKGGRRKIHHEQASLSEASKSHPQRHGRRCRDGDPLSLILAAIR
jgi:hypothetical protein